MKKFACLLMCLSAQVAQANHLPFTGFYLTGAVGLTDARLNTIPNATLDIFQFAFPSSTDTYDLSASGLLGVGYLYQFNHRFVLGGEFTAGYTQINASYRDSFEEIFPPDTDAKLAVDAEINMTNDFALLLKPGIVCGENTLFYALLGPRWANFEVTTNTNTNVIALGGPFVAVASGNESGYELGFTAGVGIQQIVTEHFHVSLEYAYTDYGKIEAPGATTELLDNGTPTGSFFVDEPEITASTNTFMLALSYQWK